MSLKHFIASIRFLTVLPVKSTDTSFEPLKMLPYFPVVGLIIGILLSLFDFLLRKKIEVQIVSLFDIAFLIAITGGLHLDGLADTADGLFSHKDKNEVLEIMKDSRIGTMGIVSVFFVLMLKWLAISHVQTPVRFWGLIVTPALSRSSIIFATQMLPYCRERGLGKEFVKKTSFKIFLPFVFICICFVFILKTKFINLIIAFLVVFLIIINFYKNKLNCITGDMLGALNEVIESFLFFSLIF